VIVDNFMFRRYGVTKAGSGTALFNGAVRNNWRACLFSDRDTARFEAPFYIRPLGRLIANRRLVQTCVRFRPDLLLIGNCDVIRNRTLAELRIRMPGLRMAHINVDALWQKEPTCAHIQLGRVEKGMTPLDVSDFARRFNRLMSDVIPPDVRDVSPQRLIPHLPRWGKMPFKEFHDSSLNTPLGFHR